MHYFQFNIGDYASHTSRLTPLEDLAYRRMLDLYYLNEQPLNGFVADIAREIGLSEYVNEVEYVLGKFFTQEVDTFSQKRIDLEIKKYKSNAKNKSRAGKASAKARAARASSKVTGVEQVLNTSSTNVEQNIKHKPLTINHKPSSNKDIVTITGRFSPPSDIETVSYFIEKGSTNIEAEKFWLFYDSKNWVVGKSKMKKWKSSASGWIARNKTEENKTDILAASSASNWHEEDLGL